MGGQPGEPLLLFLHRNTAPTLDIADGNHGRVLDLIDVVGAKQGNAAAARHEYDVVPGKKTHKAEDAEGASLVGEDLVLVAAGGVNTEQQILAREGRERRDSGTML